MKSRMEQECQNSLVSLSERNTYTCTAQTKNFGQNKPCLLWEADYQYSFIKPVNGHFGVPLTIIQNSQR